MKKRELDKRIAELEGRIRKLEESPWQFIPYIPQRRIIPGPCCPYLDKCTACPYRNSWQITWDDNTSTQTDTWTDDGQIQITYNAA